MGCFGSRVMNMSFMFWRATSFNQDLSGWNVSRVKNMTDMFKGATLLSFQTMVVSSLFAEGCEAIPKKERQRMFAGVFNWQRRRGFMLFLVNHGYVYSSSVASNYERQATKSSSEVVPCDAIFDVEDIYRYICQFL